MAHHCAHMDASGLRVRRQVRAAREIRGWRQVDLAREAGVGRRTVQRLEDGERLGEGKESKIEAALDWQIGSLDEIRADRQPIPVPTQETPLADMGPQEAVERAEEIARRSGKDEDGEAFIVRWAAERKRARESNTDSDRPVRPNGGY